MIKTIHNHMVYTIRSRLQFIAINKVILLVNLIIEIIRTQQRTGEKQVGNNEM